MSNAINNDFEGGTYTLTPEAQARQHVLLSGWEVKLLDHGYLKFVEAWGSDQSIVEAARMSTQKGFLGWGEDRFRCKECSTLWRLNLPSEIQPDGSWSLFDSEQRPKKCCDNVAMGEQIEKMPGDEKLLRYLYENNHATPFEMAGFTVEVQAPIFVFREWHRHRVPFGYNEASARYAPLPDLNYIPTVERLMANGGSNKQAGLASGAQALTEESAERFRRELAGNYEAIEIEYQLALKSGVPKELARILLPVGRYSKMRATGNLRGWLSFMALRSAPNAQYEIRVYSDAIGQLVKHLFPRTWALFSEGKNGS